MTTNKDEMTARIEKWIADGKNPGTAHWHGALEAAMKSFAPHLAGGRLAPVRPLEKADYPVFRELYTHLDLCPTLQAAFIPGSMGGVLTPPAAVDGLRRIHKDNRSAMLLCRRPGNQPRLLCAEISKDAWKPGVDIFQEGGLLGNYEYDNSDDCIRALPKLIRAHLWHKETWTAAETAAYTLNWFTRVAETGLSDAPVQPDFSYIHSPTLLRLKPVEAIFKLVHAMVVRQLQEDGAEKPSAAGEEERQRFIEGRMLDLLNLLRDSRAVDFAAFTPAENEAFKDGFATTAAALAQVLAENIE